MNIIVQRNILENVCQKKTDHKDRLNVERKSYLAKNTALFALNSIGTRLITFFLVPLYTKTFTTAEYGTIDIITTIATILVPIITMNIGEAVMRFSLDENANKNNIVNVGLLFTGISLLMGTSVIFVLFWFPNIIVSGKIVYIYCISQGLYQTLSCNLRGQEKLLNYAIGNILNTLTAAILNVFFLFILDFGIEGYFYAYIIAFLALGVYCFITGDVIKALNNFYIDITLTRNMIKYSIILVPNSLMWWIMNSLDHIMVTSMISIAANGIYAISYKLPSILSALSTIFNQAWSYSAIHESESNDKEEFNNNMYDKLVRFQLIVTIVLMSILKPFLKIYVQPEYYDAWKYTPYLLVGNFFLTMATFLSTSYTVHKDSKGFLFSSIIGAILNISFNWIMIPIMGIHGAAISTCISYIAVFFYRVKDTRKYMFINVFKPIYILGYAILVITAITMAISNIFGQILMIFEVIIILILNHRFVKKCFQLFMSIFRHIVLR